MPSAKKLFYRQRFKVVKSRLELSRNKASVYNGTPTTIGTETVNLLIQRTNFEKLAFSFAFCANTVPLEDITYCTTSCGATSGHFK